MSAIDILRNEYPGDAAWGRFVDVFRPAWELSKDKQDATDKFGSEDIAIVLSASLREDSAEWFYRPIGVLGKRSPSEVLRNEPQGLTILKTLLMRMPR